jgi:thiol-disulfide isomerase/thioredoxin
MARRSTIFCTALLLLLTAWCTATAYAGVGDPAKLDGPLIDGKKFTMEAEHGKVVLVVLWATWCPVCRKELPKIEAFYRENAAKGFDVVAVSVDDTPKEVREFLAKNHYSFPVGWRNEFKDNLGPIKGTPTIVLIDRKGVIRARTEGALDDAGWWTIEDEIAVKQVCNDLWYLPNWKHRVL